MEIYSCRLFVKDPGRLGHVRETSKSARIGLLLKSSIIKRIYRLTFHLARAKLVLSDFYAQAQRKVEK